MQKVLAHAGVASRRACEEMILQGRVSVDGKVVRELGTRVNPAAQAVAIDGQRIKEERHVYYAVNKPKGYVSTNDDPSGRPRVLDILPEIPQRVYTVGRLDEMSVGLMILTNDGELANKLAHPKFGVEKVYRVVVAGSPTHEVLDKVIEGVWLAEGKVRARRIKIVGKKGDATVLDMVLAEGKNREVRRMLAKFGHKVMALTRVAIGPITLRGLNPGAFRPLMASEVSLLRKVADGMPVPGIRFAERRSTRSPTRPGGPPTGSGSGLPPRIVGRPAGTGPRSRHGAPPPPRPADSGPPPYARPQDQGGGGVRRPSGPPPRPDGPARRPGGPPPRYQGGPGQAQAGGVRRAGGPPQRPEGPPRRPGGPPPRPQAGAGRPGQGPAGGPRHRPQGGPGGNRRPPSSEPPARRIIGLEPAPQYGDLRLPSGPPPSQRGPAARRPGPPPRRPDGPPPRIVRPPEDGAGLRAAVVRSLVAPSGASTAPGRSTEAVEAAEAQGRG